MTRLTLSQLSSLLLRAHQRACLTALENLHDKYAMTLKDDRSTAECGYNQAAGILSGAAD